MSARVAASRDLDPPQARPRPALWAAPIPGAALFVLAGLADVAIHMAGGSQSWATTAHVATLFGMVATLAGVVISGAAIHRPTRRHKETRDAIR